MRYEEQQATYFNCVVKTWRCSLGGYHPYPWSFSVTPIGGMEHNYIGIPNQCGTRHSALMRGWYRAKWFGDGSISKRYT